jgi:hypothetical protein
VRITWTFEHAEAAKRRESADPIRNDRIFIASAERSGGAAAGRLAGASTPLE